MKASFGAAKTPEDAFVDRCIVFDRITESQGVIMALTQRKIQPAIDHGIERGKHTRPTSTELVHGVRPDSLVNSTMVFAVFIFALVCLYVIECAYLQSLTHTRDHLKDQYSLLKIQQDSLRSAIISQNKQEVIQAWAVKHGMTLAPNSKYVVHRQSN